ncbi:restriction endonuclease subunit S [Geothrix paludis]|uniref:restriction endonuclease subunit S n=1 Tax=Geothrix paludis TaxID=2922722 RepID=UPI001FAD9B8A|nr:restriction endonuclease subunit S [Geothrix paludis]
MTSWPSHPIADLGTVYTGSTPSTADDSLWGGNIPFVTPGELDHFDPITKAERTISAAGESVARMLPQGAVLVCCIGSLGKVGIAGQPLATNQQINSIVFNEDLVWPRYGFHACRLLKKKLVGMAPATTVAIVSKSKFEQLSLPLPPLLEQRRIAAILDQVEVLRAKRRTALAKLDTLAQSIFIETFGDPVANSMGWPDTTPLGDVADIVSGITIGRNLDGLATREVPYLAVVNVQDREIRLDVLKSTEATEVEIARFRLQKNDLLLTEGGDPDKLGRGSLWHGEVVECIHQNHVFRVRLTSRVVHPLFLNWLVGSRRGKTYFLKSAKQTTGIASINMTQLRGFPLLLPPMALQEVFAKRMDLVDHMKTEHRRSLAHFDALFASLQYRAFRGEL